MGSFPGLSRHIFGQERQAFLGAFDGVVQEQIKKAQLDTLQNFQRLGTVAQTFALAGRTFSIVRHNLWWAAIYNAVCVPRSRKSA